MARSDKGFVAGGDLVLRVYRKSSRVAWRELSGETRWNIGKKIIWLDWLDYQFHIADMKTWPLQKAKDQFSYVVELAQAKGPQTVTRHGEPVVVIVSADEFKRATRPKETVAEFFAPLKNSGIRLERHRDFPRKLKL